MMRNLWGIFAAVLVIGLCFMVSRCSEAAALSIGAQSCRLSAFSYTQDRRMLATASKCNGGALGAAQLADLPRTVLSAPPGWGASCKLTSAVYVASGLITVSGAVCYSDRVFINQFE